MNINKLLKKAKKSPNELTIEEFDVIVKEASYNAAYRLSKHPLFNLQHIDYIVEKDPWAAAEYLNKHPLLNQKHINTILKKKPGAAARCFQGRLSEENLEYLATKYPYLYEELFK